MLNKILCNKEDVMYIVIYVMKELSGWYDDVVK